ncbi:hypothetical protein [Mucilaginibacter arboris]|uniref:Uncharacterized protein n=1 Tax=Mucilaginibacter arboris TaxID=2682090 RepID=A0A7K1T0C3_9SPHI|nr:hypothetical protein [Mucilaginibacter arboris]MVN22967.1 hypothetical protein [Mucilaginibacter arboris]
MLKETLSLNAHSITKGLIKVKTKRMKMSALKLMMIAGVMTLATSFAANAIPVKAFPFQESRDTLRKGKTDTTKKGKRMKRDTTGERIKTDTVAKT